MVAAAVVAVQVGVDDDVDGVEIEVLLAERAQPRLHVVHQRVQLGHAGIDEDPGLRMVDDVDVDRHPLAFDVEVGDEDGGDGDPGRFAHGSNRLQVPSEITSASPSMTLMAVSSSIA